MSFDGKVVLVTGASSGIGRAIALHFAKLKAKVVLIGRDKRTLDEATCECTTASGYEAVGLQADVSRHEEVARVVAATSAAHGRLDVLVNNAGVFIADDIFTASLQSFDAHVGVNLRGTFDLTRLCVPLLVASAGNVVNVSGIEATRYWEGLLTDSISKVGIQTLSKYVAKELGPKRVRSNCVALGFVKGTKIIERANLDPEEFEADWLKSAPLEQVITPEEVADVVEFLASDKAKHITGQTIAVDCGFSIA